MNRPATQASMNGARRHMADCERPEPPARLGCGGHGPKIAEAVAALRAGGQLPPLLRAVERDSRIIRWLVAAGYGKDLPSRRSIRRAFDRETQAAAC